jgi:hypothetical protein
MADFNAPLWGKIVLFRAKSQVCLPHGAGFVPNSHFADTARRFHYVTILAVVLITDALAVLAVPLMIRAFFYWMA